MLVVEIVEVVKKPVLQSETLRSLRVAGVPVFRDDVGIGDRGLPDRKALAVAVVCAARPKRVAREVEEIALTLTKQVGGGWRPLDHRVALPRTMQRHLRVIEHDADRSRPPSLSGARLLLVSERRDRRIPLSQPLLGTRSRTRRSQSERNERRSRCDQLPSTH
jgi:hypothetical protein